MKNANERFRFELGPDTEYHAAEANAENGSVTARVCPYGVPDGRTGEWRGKPYVATVYEPGCWTNWIETYGTGRTKFMFDHGDADIAGVEFGENALPIGAVTSFDDRADGLYFSADFASAERAQSVRELASMGGLTDVSHGSNVRVAEVRADGYRHVTEAQLWDVSIVVWGQFLEDAQITEVRRKETRNMEITITEPQTTLGAALAGEAYEEITELLADYLQDGTLTVMEVASVDLAAILNAIVAALPADLASKLVDVEDDDDLYYYRRTGKRIHNAHTGDDPEIDASKPDATTLAASPETGVSAEAPTESELLALQTENDSRLRLAAYAELLP